jgi:hypothetical protein
MQRNVWALASGVAVLAFLAYGAATGGAFGQITFLPALVGGAIGTGYRFRQSRRQATPMTRGAVIGASVLGACGAGLVLGGLMGGAAGAGGGLGGSLISGVISGFGYWRIVQNWNTAVENATPEEDVDPTPIHAQVARTERECPWCAEQILAKARVCKHCGRHVEPTAPAV